MSEQPQSRTLDLINQHHAYVIPTYTPSLVMVKGRGARVWDSEGNRYLDFTSGIAVDVLGHCHPKLVRTVKRQAARLMHMSNLYFNEHQPPLAEKLSALSLGGKCFFCNSGAEANEALIKLARLWGNPRGKYEVLCMHNSFHGRTLATLTATGQSKIQQGFQPLPMGFAWAAYNDLEAVRAALTHKTAAILVEPILGEGGVVPADPAFLQGLRALCNERDILLLCDEIQTGMGRTGKWFGYQHYDFEPDALSLAKGLGGGVPIGAIVTGKKLADVFQPSTHGSTFGGNPGACAAARTVIDVIEKDHLVEQAEKLGGVFEKKLEKLVEKYGFIEAVRGKGLMRGLAFDRPVADLAKIMTRMGLLTIPTAGNVIRLLPPLTVSAAQVRRAVKIIGKACEEWKVYQTSENAA